MTDALASNEATASELAKSIQVKLDGYLAFKLGGLSVPDPVLGSSAHDSLSGPVADALSAWRELITSDATALVSAAGEFGLLDASLAGGLLGAGE